ncbi:MAG: pilin [Candidatus Saccharimonadales bacterium]
MNRLRIAIVGLFTAFALTIAFAAPALAQTDQISRGLCTGANLEFSTNPTDSCDDRSSAEKINAIVHSIINLISAIVGIVAVVMIIWGGLRYVTSGGNEAGVTSAKNTILYAIIGLIIVALAQLMVRFTLSKIVNS